MSILFHYGEHTKLFNNTFQLPPPFLFFQPERTANDKTGMKGSESKDAVVPLRKLLTLQICTWTKEAFCDLVS